MIPDNARILRITAAAGTELADACSITAAAGTELADACSCGTLTGAREPLLAPAPKRFTTRRAFIPHAAWLVQPYGH